MRKKSNKMRHTSRKKKTDKYHNHCEQARYAYQTTLLNSPISTAITGPRPPPHFFHNRPPNNIAQPIPDPTTLLPPRSKIYPHHTRAPSQQPCTLLSNCTTTSVRSSTGHSPNSKLVAAMHRLGSIANAWRMRGAARGTVRNGDGWVGGGAVAHTHNQR